VLAPSALTGRLDQTYRSASPADVTQLLRASSRTPLPLAAALLSGAQKWEREPTSENASVPSARPAAIARRLCSSPCASTTAAAQ